jgi:hypothetical protein
LQHPFIFPLQQAAADSCSFLTIAASADVAVITTPLSVFSTVRVTPSAAIGQSLQHVLSLEQEAAVSWIIATTFASLAVQVILTPFARLVTARCAPAAFRQQAAGDLAWGVSPATSGSAASRLRAVRASRRFIGLPPG